MSEHAPDVYWASVQWDVCRPPATALIEGTPLTSTHWTSQLVDVSAVVSVPWGPSQQYMHDVPVSPSVAHNCVTLYDVVHAVGTHYRRMMLLPRDLQPVIHAEEERGSRRAAAQIRELSARGPCTPMSLLSTKIRWGGIVFDTDNPSLMRLKLI